MVLKYHPVKWCVGAAFAICAFECASSLPAHAAPPPGYTLAWSDEFNRGVGNGPDASKWQFETGPNHANGESEIYVADKDHAQIVADPNAVDGQALQILTTESSAGAGEPNVYNSIRMNSAGRYTFQYGFVEARIRMPYGKGIWPAFWMLGNNIGQVGWPRCGEIDIMENIGQKSWWGRNLSSLHSAGGPKLTDQITQNAPYVLPDGQDFYSSYHLFQMLWLKDAISFYVDGKLFETRTATEYGKDPWPFNAPFFMILNTAVGGQWPGYPDATTVFPQRMLVDYVRVYSGQPVAPTAPEGVTASPDDNGRIRISWSGDVAATGYDIYRGTKASGEDAVPVQTGVAATTFMDTGLVPSHSYYYKVVAVNPAGQSTLSREAHAVAPANIDAPYAGKPAAIPGTISLVEFDRGGEGVTYHDSDPENHGGALRPYDGVDIEDSEDGGYDIGWTAPGEWMIYTVKVAKAGRYQLSAMVASDGPGGSFHIEDEKGTNITGPIAVAPTGGWQKWTTVTASATLTAGVHRLRLFEDTGGYNLRSLTFAAAAP